MMKRAVLIAIVIVIAVMAAGCLKQPERIGCCLRPNASVPDGNGDVGCVLYNTTSLLEQPEFYSQTEWCNLTTGCNVSIGSDHKLLPICTDDQLVACIEPDCNAMVCGDFAFKPRVAPGFTDTESAAGDTPANLEEDTAGLQFYKGQCRFLPMDAKLNKIMKASKSQINVFRMGAGGSFDEYDQYRYFLPISDKYCSMSISSGGSDTIMIDRYMNYLTTEKEEFYPEEDIVDNCMDDLGNPRGTDTPFGFSDYSGPLYFNFEDEVSSSYEPILPDYSNYKTTYVARMNYWADWNSEDECYDYDSAFVDTTGGIYKKIDSAYYRKELSIAHVATMYGDTSAGSTRAPFECGISSAECYSGRCSTEIYSRGVLLSSSGSEEAEVVSDCNAAEDPMGFRIVVCSPTKSVTPQGERPPIREYAGLAVKTFHINLAELGDSPFVDYGEVTADDDDADASGCTDNQVFCAWDSFGPEIYSGGDSGTGDTRYGYLEQDSEGEYLFLPWIYTASDVSYEWENCDDDDDDEWCDSVTHETMGPPAGGIVFFGQVGDGDYVNYDDGDGASDIIGYALLTEDDFKGTLFYKECDLEEGTDYTVVDLTTAMRTVTMTGSSCTEDDDCSGFACSVHGCDCAGGKCQYQQEMEINPDSPEWKKLMTSFRKYFTRYVKEGLGGNNFDEDGCGDYAETLDVVFAGMPWVINFEKGNWNVEDDYESAITYNLASTSAQVIRERNIYDEDMSQVPGTTSCELRRTAGEYHVPWLADIFGLVKEYYNVVYSPYVILIKKPSDGTIGSKCLLDESTGLPKVKTFGWCEPCTSSTLAYQEIKVNEDNSVYMPGYTADIGTGESRNAESICEVAYTKGDWDWGDFSFDWTDNVSCFNQHITDVNEYREQLGDLGAPRTDPDATIIKERLGDYLKSGVMPVLDMKDSSNWEMDNPERSSDYAQYDFERLFGNMGAVVVIVDDIGSEADDVKLEQIAERTNTVATFCPRCLTAVHVNSPANNETFTDIVYSMTADNRIQANLDVITFDYPVSNHHDVYDSIPGLDNKSAAIAEDIASYGMGSLSLGTKGKPVMVVGFNVKDDDPTWNGKESYTKLFQGITFNQDKLVSSGVIGLIYKPASTEIGDTQYLGLVDRTPMVGIKTSKFCAFENALQLMSLSPSVAMFNRVAARAPPINCTACTSIDRALKLCGTEATEDPLLCDDGYRCDLPDGLPESEAKCPEKTVSTDCPLCNETGGQYICNITYTNGTTKQLGPGPMSEVSTDAFMDVVAGMPAPYKCCLGSGEGDLAAKYTYVKDVHQSPLNKPIVFSKSGDPDVNCGMSASGEDVGAISEFCGMQQMPLKDYDIECAMTFSLVEPTEGLDGVEEIIPGPEIEPDDLEPLGG